MEYAKGDTDMLNGQSSLTYASAGELMNTVASFYDIKRITNFKEDSGDVVRDFNITLSAENSAFITIIWTKWEVI